MLLVSCLVLVVLNQNSIYTHAENFFVTFNDTTALLPELYPCHTNLVINKEVKLKPGPLSMSPLTLHRFSVKPSLYWDMGQKVYHINNNKIHNKQHK